MALKTDPESGVHSLAEKLTPGSVYLWAVAPSLYHDK